MRPAIKSEEGEVSLLQQLHLSYLITSCSPLTISDVHAMKLTIPFIQINFESLSVIACRYSTKIKFVLET